MAFPTSLPECAERLDAAQAAVATSQKVVRVLGGVALAVGIGWALWEIVGRKKAEAAQTESTSEVVT
jgi:uncharacterized protein YjeT (DUF2065 family)